MFILVVLVFVGMGVQMIQMAFLMCLAISVGMGMTWVALPRGVRWCLTLPGIRWVIDALITVAAPLFMGITATAVMAAAILGITTTLMLEVSAYNHHHKEE